jgi:hypothetical protein
MIIRLRLNLLPGRTAPASRVDTPIGDTRIVDTPAASSPPEGLHRIEADAVLRALSEAGQEHHAGQQHAAPDPNVVTPREMIHGLTHMLTPACAIAYALSLWRIGEDMGWARPFAIRTGLLSHWQVWFGIGVAVQMIIQTLRRRFRNDDDQNQALS